MGRLEKALSQSGTSEGRRRWTDRKRRTFDVVRALPRQGSWRTIRRLAERDRRQHARGRLGGQVGRQRCTAGGRGGDRAPWRLQAVHLASPRDAGADRHRPRRPHGGVRLARRPSGCGKTTLLRIIAGLLADERQGRGSAAALVAGQAQRAAFRNSASSSRTPTCSLG